MLINIPLQKIKDIILYKDWLFKIIFIDVNKDVELLIRRLLNILSMMRTIKAPTVDELKNIKKDIFINSLGIVYIYDKKLPTFIMKDRLTLLSSIYILLDDSNYIKKICYCYNSSNVKDIFICFTVDFVLSEINPQMIINKYIKDYDFIWLDNDVDFIFY